MKTALLAILWAAKLVAQAPVVSNAHYDTKAVSGDGLVYLHNTIRAENGPAWFGYAVESSQTDDESCCWTNDYRGCQLEGGNGHGVRIADNGPVKLEGSRLLFVLFRIQDHAIVKIQPVSGTCPVDAGGLRFTWLTGVDPKTSIALLGEMLSEMLSERVEGATGHHLADSAMVSIALHASTLADEALERFAAPSQPERIRDKALFWLASSRGSRGFNVVKQAAEHDPSEHIREKAMFDLSICKQPEAIDALIHFARQDPAARVRSQALFWLGQKAASKAVDAIQDAVLNDPDTDVKKKAVFALQNLPKDQGVPLLIDTARNNRNPEVRKQAMFWLGQSGDPRALAFFQEVLRR